MLGIISGGISAISGAAKFFEGRRMKRKAQEAMSQFEWQELENPYESLQVSTLGADLAREEMSRTTATSVDALREAGTRGLVGGLGRVQRENTLMNREIGADLDMQQRRIDEMRAGQDVMNQNMFEQRQTTELQGLGKMMDTGIDMKYGGFADIATGFESAAAGIGGLKKDNNPTSSKKGGFSYEKTKPLPTAGQMYGGLTWNN